MVPDILRDSSFGILVNRLSKGALLPYPDQRIGFVLPEQYRNAPNDLRPSSTSTLVERGTQSARRPMTGIHQTGDRAEGNLGEKGDRDRNGPGTATELGPRRSAEIGEFGLDRPGQSEYIIVDWLAGDPENPVNWSSRKRCFVAGLISFMTTGVYIGSAIYTSGTESIMQEFGVIQVVATLGLSLFILGYGIGPMFLSPLQDVVAIGRSPIFVAGLTLFVLFQVPVIFAPNIGTIMVFRFFAGFVGSPALASGATSMTELFPMHVWPYAIGLWSISAVCGPIFGPVIGGFAAQAHGWRWPIYELLWLSGAALICLIFLLPETNGKTILHRRARRLRRLTGNSAYRTRHEVDKHPDETIFRSVKTNFVVGLQVSADPALGFANFYIGLVYSVFYLWFEAFPIVFQQFHHFRLGVAGLPYLGFVVSAVVTFAFYCWYQHAIMTPRMRSDSDFGPESRLELGIIAGCFIPVSLLMFGWGAKAHWMVPVVGAALYLPGIFMLFQSILMFISTYAAPRYNSSVMASNTFFRSTFASAFPLFGSYFFKALGVGPACSLLAGVSLLMIPILWLLKHYCRRLRARSRWTTE